MLDQASCLCIETWQIYCSSKFVSKLYKLLCRGGSGCDFSFTELRVLRISTVEQYIQVMSIGKETADNVTVAAFGIQDPLNIEFIQATCCKSSLLRCHLKATIMPETVPEARHVVIWGRVPLAHAN